MDIILSIIFFLKITAPGFTANTCTSSVNTEFQSNEGIELIINNIRNNQGVLRIGFYDSEIGFPEKPSVSYSLLKDSISNGMLHLHIPLSKAGNYSISILDDENRNGKMDYTLGIIPIEGFGFTNNPGVSLKAPRFSETTIKFTGGKLQVIVKMKYI